MKLLQKYHSRFDRFPSTGCKNLGEATNGVKVDELNTTAVRPELVEGCFCKFRESLQ